VGGYDIFEGIGPLPPDAPAEEVKEEGQKGPSFFAKIMANPCGFWGGPIQPVTDDSLYSFVERFWGGVTTAHGCNRIFDDDNGIVRRIFWLGLFVAGFYGAILFGGSSIFEFLEKGVVTSLGEEVHPGHMPQVTVCAQSAFKCSCAAFYEEDVLTTNFAKVMPYLCFDALVFKDKDNDDPADPAPDLAGIDAVSGAQKSYTTCDLFSFSFFFSPLGMMLSAHGGTLI
jgi:hypothetical protein